MSALPYLLFLLILIVACLYASVGHGGASGYLALMTLFAIPIATIKPVALVLNCVVSLIAFIQFYQQGHFNKQLFLFLAIGSVPAAYIGSLIKIDPTLYKQLLGALLLLTAIRIAIPLSDKKYELKKANLFILIFIGACIGLLSGIIGIGGGIILSPLLIILAYSDIKTTAGISALFIFVNSIAGLIGLMQQTFLFTSDMNIMIVIAMIGGIIGAYFGAKQLHAPLLKKILAFVLFVAAVKLILI